MKCYLTGDEFEVMVRALARHFDHDDAATMPFDVSAFQARLVPPSPLV